MQNGTTLLGHYRFHAVGIVIGIVCANAAAGIDDCFDGAVSIVFIGKGFAVCRADLRRTLQRVAGICPLLSALRIHRLHTADLVISIVHLFPHSAGPVCFFLFQQPSVYGIFNLIGLYILSSVLVCLPLQ